MVKLKGFGSVLTLNVWRFVGVKYNIQYETRLKKIHESYYALAALLSAPG